MVDKSDVVRPRNPVWNGEGRPSDEDRKKFMEEINETNADVLKKLGEGPK